MSEPTTADELAGWKSVLSDCDRDTMETRMFLRQERDDEGYFRARLAARQCARDAVAARIAAMEEEAGS